MDLITTHKNADFDALASTFAAALVYPSSSVVLPRNLNRNVKEFLGIHKDVFRYRSHNGLTPERYNRLIVVDTNDWSRLDLPDSFREDENLSIHIWDHHPGVGTISADWSCIREVGAAVTLLVDQLKKDDAPLSPIQATLFLAGIHEDTGSLLFPSTTPLDAASAAFLMEQGADVNMIARFLRPTYTQNQKELLFHMLRKAREVDARGLMAVVTHVPINGHSPGLSLVVDMFHGIAGADIIVCLFSERSSGKTIIIARSSGESLDVGRIMSSLGGGGHPNAASALIRGSTPDKVEAAVMEALTEAVSTSGPLMAVIMSYPVISVEPSATMKDAALMFRSKGFTGIPVIQGKRLVGIISRRDFTKIKKTRQLDAPVKAFMSTNVITVAPDASVREVARLMSTHDIGRVPVVENDSVVGIVTRSDVMRYYYDLLPD
ncbi:MAG TPA: CBS domain-containing protein [Desulfobacteraceae bacterium]|nr:CBS domain-containing protein [Desulfobacteraceae bacterium]